MRFMPDWLAALLEEDVDSKPTSASHPRETTLEALPEEYRSLLASAVKDASAIRQIVFSPRPVQLHGLCEQVIARTDDAVFYAERLKNGALSHCLIPLDAVCAVCETHDMLLGVFGVSWRAGDGVRTTRMRYNRVREDLFAPVLNALVGCDLAFNSARAVCQGRPAALMAEEYALYNYANELYRLGEPEGEWGWWKTERRGLLLRRRKAESSVLLCAMTRGQGILQIAGTRIDAWYLHKGRACASLVTQEGRSALRMEAMGTPIGEIAHIQIK